MNAARAGAARLTVVALLLAACRTTPPMPAPPPHHPASPLAAEAPAPAPTGTLHMTSPGIGKATERR